MMNKKLIGGSKRRKKLLVNGTVKKGGVGMIVRSILYILLSKWSGKNDKKKSGIILSYKELRMKKKIGEKEKKEGG